jgi:hypothetical protein
MPPTNRECAGKVALVTGASRGFDRNGRVLQGLTNGTWTVTHLHQEIASRVTAWRVREVRQFVEEAGA